MWSRIGLLFFSVLFIVSCKKDVEPWDKEVNLSIDSSVFMYAGNYLSHSDSTLTYEFEIVQLNQLESEINYLDVVLERYQDYGVSDYYSYKFFDITRDTKSPISNYSTLFLIETTSYSIFFEGQAGFYLNRFFQQVEGKTPQKNIGLATFESNENVNLTFNKEHNQLFQNSAAYNDSIVTNIIHKSEFNGHTYSNSVDFRDMMFAVMDTLNNNAAAFGEKSITIIDDMSQNGIEFIDELIMKEIVDYANLFGIKINVICFNSYQYFNLAQETGGFYVDYREFNRIEPDFDSYQVSSAGNAIANLDRILTHDLTSLKFKMELNNKGYFTLYSGEIVYPSFRMNNNIFRIALKIP